MDLVAMEGGTLAPVPARLLHGQGCRCKAYKECGILTAEDPYFGSLRCCCVITEGTAARAAEAIPPMPPAVPPATPPLVEEHIALMPTSCPNKICNHHAHLVSSLLRAYVGATWPHPPDGPSLVILTLPRLPHSTTPWPQYLQSFQFSPLLCHLYVPSSSNGPCI